MSKTYGNIKKEVADLIHRNKLAKKKFLLAVSGGADSVLLAHLFHDLKLKFAIAHINYSLRGKESDEDAVFVKNLAQLLKAKFYYKKFNKKDVKVKGESVQMRARNLRYSTFTALLKEEKFNYVVLAHHANDQVETVLMNLFRGTGINGLTGMDFCSGEKLRPLLGISKKEIQKCLKEKKIKYRNDSSNFKNDYKRNYLRNTVIGSIEKEWPGLHKTMLRNIENFKLIEKALQQRNKQTVKQLDFSKPFSIAFSKLNDNAFTLNVFLELAHLQKFNVASIHKLLNASSNESKSLKGLNGILEFKNKIISYSPYGFSKPEPVIKLVQNKLTISGYQPDFLRSSSERISKLRIKGNIRLKKWEPGDKMVPLGMNGSKKISDLLTELKLSALQKANVYLLCDDEKPLWLLGLRIDNRVKLTGGEPENEILNIRIV